MSFRVAACQMNSQDNKAENLAKAEKLIDEAASLGADVIALPEMFNILGSDDDTLNAAEPIPGPTSEFLQRKARQHHVHIHGGSMPEQASAGKVWNTTLLYGPDGEEIGRYRKIHLFDIEIAGQPAYRESSKVAYGEEMITCESEHGQFGLTICYDIRFPELYRQLTLAGARLIFQPAAFTLYTGKDHWEALIRARAIENQVYMVSPAQFGNHPPNKQCYGNSLIVDPWGTVLVRAAERECVIFADIDYSYQDMVREQLPSLKHRRPEVYA